MSSSMPFRYVGPTFERERYEQFDKMAQWLYEVDNAPDETGFRSKLKNLLKRTRIHAVVTKLVEQSKSFLSSLASRLTPDATPHESDHAAEKSIARATEQVSFPEGNTAAPNVSSGTVYSRAINPPSVENKLSNGFVHSAASVSKPTKRGATNHQSTDELVCRVKNADGRAINQHRYKEEKQGKQLKFPEIEIGIVSLRAQWLHPILLGEKVPVKALETHHSGELALRNGERECDQLPSNTESDDESAFDDSPRLFRHRLPEDEPEPWVEPGMVAKGAIWLQPVFSGEKRRTSRDNLASPTRISHGMFH